MQTQQTFICSKSTIELELICLKLTIKTPERRLQRHQNDVVDFEQISAGSDVAIIFLGTPVYTTNS